MRSSRPQNLNSVLLISITTAAALFAAGSLTAQEAEKTAIPPAKPPVAEIRDLAGLFSRQAITSARPQLERITAEAGVSIAIETIDSLNDEPAIDVARRLAKRTKVEGVFILIAKKERILEELIPKSQSAQLTEARRTAIRAAFLDQFRHKDFDRGLTRGVEALGENLLVGTAVNSKMQLPGPSDSTSVVINNFSDAAPTQKPAPGSSPLIERGRVRLTLEGARTLIAAAEAKALALTKAPKFNIAVVDEGGHLLAFERMDVARPASIYTAITKATSAATFRQPTGPATGKESPPPANPLAPEPVDQFTSLSLQAASGGRITSLLGGLPIFVDGHVIGAIGIGGGVGDQDVEIARAAVQSFLDQVQSPRPPASTAPATSTTPP